MNLWKNPKFELYNYKRWSIDAKIFQNNQIEKDSGTDFNHFRDNSGLKIFRFWADVRTYNKL